MNSAGYLFRHTKLRRNRRIMENTRSTTIEMTIPAELVSRFYPLLVAGIRINARTVCSIKDLLCRQIGIGEEYLEKRIQTIFLDYKPIDDVDAPVVLDGSILSLSAAMPGLVGATLRRGGHLAAMRAQISHSQKETTENDPNSKVTLKLFNLTTRDIGAFFLAQGIWISGKDFEDVLKTYGSELQKGCRMASLDKQEIDVEKLLGMDWKSKEVFLKIIVGQD